MTTWIENKWAPEGKLTVHHDLNTIELSWDQRMTALKQQILAWRDDMAEKMIDIMKLSWATIDAKDFTKIDFDWLLNTLDEPSLIRFRGILRNTISALNKFPTEPGEVEALKTQYMTTMFPYLQTQIPWLNGANIDQVWKIIPLAIMPLLYQVYLKKDSELIAKLQLIPNVKV